MDTAIRPAKDLAGLLNYAPPRVREQPQAPLVKDKPPMERPLRSLGVETAAPMGREDFAVNLRRRVSLDPELVPEPKSLKDRVERGNRAAADWYHGHRGVDRLDSGIVASHASTIWE